MRRAFRITHWAFLTVFLYAATLLILWWPVILAAFSGWGEDPIEVDGKDVFSFYTEPRTWVALSVLALVQGLFLLVPLQIERNRPVSRRHWGLLAAVAALMMGLLFAGLCYAAGEAITKTPFVLAEELFSKRGFYAVLPLLLGLLIWIGWGWLFWSYGRSQGDDASRLSRVTRWLVGGSIAELLIAVPCHVYVRHKEYCCAGFNTFIGMAVGLAVLLFAFGPGVFFLFVRRTRELRKAHASSTEGPIAPLWGRRARDGRVWCAIGLAFLLFCRVGVWLDRPEAAALATVGQLAFLVLWLVAIRDVWRGVHEDENGAFEVGLMALACFPLAVWSVCKLLET